MKPNVGNLDRAIRALAGVLLIAAFAFGLIAGTPGIVALVAGLVLALTAALRWCPPYALLGINTCARK